MAGKRRWMEFRLYPTYQRAYIRSFGRMLEAVHAKGKATKWENAQDVFAWWMEDDNVKGQIGLWDLAEWQGKNPREQEVGFFQ